MGVALYEASAAVVTVDEFGNGNIDGSPLLWSIAVGPGGLTLAYTLPFPVAEGEGVLWEPPTPGSVSDVIQFAGNTLFFYSDNSDGVDSPADISGLPLSPFPPTLASWEQTTPAGNGFWGYTPSSGQPGYYAGDTVTYNVISDYAVPEPSTWLAGLSALGMLASLGRRSRKA